MRKRLTITGIVLTAVSLVLSLAQPALPIVRYVLPAPYDNWNLPLPPKSEPLYVWLSGAPPPVAHPPLSAFYRLQSGSQITAGSDVWGNATFYYPRGISEADFRAIYVLVDADYRLISDLDRVKELNANIWSSWLHSYDNSTHFGWTCNFRFRSNQTGSYIFLYQTGFAQSLVVVLSSVRSLALRTATG